MGEWVIAFTCVPGSTAYLEIGLELRGQGTEPVPVLRRMEPSRGVATVAGMKRVLLP